MASRTENKLPQPEWPAARLSAQSVPAGENAFRFGHQRKKEIEKEINSIMDAVHSPVTTIPGIGTRMDAMILAEIDDFSNFDSPPDKIPAYDGCSPSIYQSGQMLSSHAHIEKRGSHYLRCALYNAAKYVSFWVHPFAACFAGKRAEGKHYHVTLSHVIKKLVRLICAMERFGKPYSRAA